MVHEMEASKWYAIALFSGKESTPHGCHMGFSPPYSEVSSLISSLEDVFFVLPRQPERRPQPSVITVEIGGDTVRLIKTATGAWTIQPPGSPEPGKS